MSQMMKTFFVTILLLVSTWNPTLAQEAENSLIVNVLSQEGYSLRNTLVHLTIGGETYTERTGEDGQVEFTPPVDGSYTLTAELSGYTFAVINEELLTTGGADMIGSKAALTLSGTVRNTNQEEISTASLTINGTPVTMNHDGSFSTSINAGEEYTLAVTDENYVFVQPKRSFKALGDRSEVFVGYPN